VSLLATAGKTGQFAADWVATASALHQRHVRKTHIRAIEQHRRTSPSRARLPRG